MIENDPATHFGAELNLTEAEKQELADNMKWLIENDPSKLSQMSNAELAVGWFHLASQMNEPELTVIDRVVSENLANSKDQHRTLQREVSIAESALEKRIKSVKRSQRFLWALAVLLSGALLGVLAWLVASVF